MRVNEQGRSMIEMLGVLAIVGVLSVGGIAGYSKAMNKFKTNKVIDQVNMISTNIRTLYSSQRNYAGLNNTLARDAGIVSSDMIDTAANSTKIINAFQGEIEITSAPHNGLASAAYIIAFNSLPKPACVAAATTDWGGDVGSGFAAMTIDTTGVNATAATAISATVTAGVQTAVPGNTSYGTPMSIITAQTACGSSTNNAIALKYI